MEGIDANRSGRQASRPFGGSAGTRGGYVFLPTRPTDSRGDALLTIRHTGAAAMHMVVNTTPSPMLDGGPAWYRPRGSRTVGTSSARGAEPQARLPGPDRLRDRRVRPAADHRAGHARVALARRGPLLHRG